MVLLTRGLSTTTLEPSAVCVEMFLYFYNKPSNIVIDRFFPAIFLIFRNI